MKKLFLTLLVLVAMSFSGMVSASGVPDPGSGELSAISDIYEPGIKAVPAHDPEERTVGGELMAAEDTGDPAAAGNQNYANIALTATATGSRGEPIGIIRS